MEVWKKCSTCKKDIPVNGKYFVCSVSTCQGRATNYAFCSVGCWDAHVPVERHRPESAGAIERTAPSTPEPATAPAVRKIIPSGSPAKSAGSADEEAVLVVVTKVRKYIADRSGMNTSAGVYDVLTERIKLICDRAVENARSQGRKTVMDRDVP